MESTIGGLSLSKKWILPAKRAFEIRFLPRLRRGKKHFYPHKCAVCRRSRKTVRAVRMFGGKVPTGLFRRSEPSYGVNHRRAQLVEKANFACEAGF